MSILNLLQQFNRYLTSDFDKANEVIKYLPTNEIKLGTGLDTATIWRLKHHQQSLDNSRGSTIKALADYYNRLVSAMNNIN